MSRIANDVANVELPGDWTQTVSREYIDNLEDNLRGDITAEADRATQKEGELEGKFNNYTPTLDIPGIKVDQAKKADVADKLNAGATMGGELVAGQDWVLARVSELNAYIIKTNNKIIGRNLVEVLNATSVKDCFQKIVAMGTNYSQLMIGDYIDIPEIVVDGIGTLKNTSGNLRVEIAGFDHYYNVGDTLTGRGILWVFRNCAFSHRMNSSNVNAGGYNSAELKGIVNGAFATGLEQAIGVTLKTVHRLVDTHGSCTWTGEKCWIPSEVEVIGHQAWGRGGYYTGTSVQYPIYAIDTSRRIKKYNGDRQWYWEGTSYSGDSAGFCSIFASGADHNSASNSAGVSPAFYI